MPSTLSSRCLVVVRGMAFVGVVLVGCNGSVVAGDSRSNASSTGGSSSSGESSVMPCYETGCRDGLELTLHALGGWKAGDYVFKIVADGAQETCKGTLPLPPCGTSGTTCDSQLAGITESGCALPPAEHSFPSFHFSSHPSKVMIHVERDGAVLADAVVEPTYRTIPPTNCSPVCTQASASITLSEH